MQVKNQVELWVRRWDNPDFDSMKTLISGKNAWKGNMEPGESGEWECRKKGRIACANRPISSEE